jgi:2-aminoadipate transaminase
MVTSILTPARHFSHRIAATTVSAVREILKVTERPEIISFAGGLPAPELFPKEPMAEAFRRVILEEGEKALQYSTTEGYRPLREWIAARMRAKGISADPNQILITSGSQQGLDLIAKALIDPGDKILVESPTYLAALQAFSLFEANTISVAGDDNGMDLEAVEQKLREHPDIKLIYLIANFQNPAGTTLALERRQRLLKLAAQYGVRILEDDPYGELRYRGDALPPIRSLETALDTGGLVTYISTFSKTIAPGLRVAWLVAEPTLYARLVMAKQSTDLHTNTISQFAIHRYLMENDADSHVAKLRQIYGERCETMLRSLARHFPAGVRWTKPEGGMFLWVELPAHRDSAKLLPAAIEAEVAFVPGAPFFPNEKPNHFLRLNFSNQTPERIETGIKKLAQVIVNNENQ